MGQIQDKVLKRLFADLFDQPVMGNTIRSFYVEALVAELLRPDWSLVSQDWAGWDIEHDNGCKGEVKQSAAVQTWDIQSSHTEKKIRPSFDIRPRSGHWVDDKWIENLKQGVRFLPIQEIPENTGSPQHLHGRDCSRGQPSA